MFSRRGGGADGSCVVTVGAARKAGATVGGAFCDLPGGAVAAADPGTVLGAGAPAGGAGGMAGRPCWPGVGAPADGGAPAGGVVPAAGGAPAGGVVPAAGGAPGG
ncbi:hypothetical protein [Bradyrhizobium sp. JYMT SZCCT0428]|uniref:hypothetical protein n=1 Tax=Bradyrhizobium sp. JYMT SZCCT0428 TaxID=2807673 RepID=UPI003908B8DA